MASRRGFEIETPFARRRSLPEKLASRFATPARQRGEQYFRERRVTLATLAPGEVRSRVQGSDRYVVHLLRQGRQLLYSCDCPYYLDHDYAPCKHLWATLLALEMAGKAALLDDGSPLVMLAEDREEDGADVLALEDELTSLTSPAWRAARPAASGWRAFFASPRALSASASAMEPDPWARREIRYLIDVASSSPLALEVAYRERRRDGGWSALRGASIPPDEARRLPEASDRRIFAVLQGAPAETYGWSMPTAPARNATRFVLPEAIHDTLLPLLGTTDRCRVRRSPSEAEPAMVEIDGESAWELVLAVVPAREPGHYRFSSRLERGTQTERGMGPARESLGLDALELVTASGWFLAGSRFGRLWEPAAARWVGALRQRPDLRLPADEALEWLELTLAQPWQPRLALPPELDLPEVAVTPVPRLSVRPAAAPVGLDPAAVALVGGGRLLGSLSFGYDGRVIAAGAPQGQILDAASRRRIRRDRVAEERAVERLAELGLVRRAAREGDIGELAFSARELPELVAALLAEGWYVEASGRRYRAPAELHLEVSSGVDWFDLAGSWDFGGERVSLPTLLAAAQRGEASVPLADGTLGMLPSEWLRRHALLATAGEEGVDRVRFRRSQLGLLAALVEEDAELVADATFRRARQELASFRGITPADPPAGFAGRLREYQREGLGWLHFLARFGFGGCLADDMGLGKTIQVLALLAAKPSDGTVPGKDGAPVAPSLVVAPKSVVFNWAQEATRFVPGLRVLVHTGPARARAAVDFQDYDLVLTTYGLLREDVTLLSSVRWRYAILDEAQAIKNATTQSAKAARLLKAEHRLALSGTPIENHLGELWSLFEFLNPGMLGRLAMFETKNHQPDAEERALLARALAPFLLRRTKEQVLTELPEKTEQTVFCDLDGKQRKLYNELKRFYQTSLREKIASVGLARAKIQVLEALLRLRQAACHPGLIAPERAREPSAKLDALLPLLAEVREGGHKALVFSQFTSFLALVRQRLDQQGATYAYLDGQTQDRAAVVERFQNDPACDLFLISLKAGGLGLNLTAADYVFLLDPWWNPAVEAQAIDRSHRLGQTRPVFAYRLVARDTVEEKILLLQESKRELAQSILSADRGLVGDLTREDLELLLG